MRIGPSTSLLVRIVTMKLSNVRKNESTTECDKSTVRYDIGNFVIYICQLLDNSVVLGWVRLATPICNVGTA